MSKASRKSRQTTIPALVGVQGVSLEAGVLIFARADRQEKPFADFRLVEQRPYPHPIRANSKRCFSAHGKASFEQAGQGDIGYVAFIPVPEGFPIAGDIHYCAKYSSRQVFFIAPTQPVGKTDKKRLLALFAAYQAQLVEILPSAIGEHHTFSQAFASFNLAAFQRGRWLKLKPEIERFIKEKNVRQAVASLTPFVMTANPQPEAETMLGQVLLAAVPAIKEKLGDAPEMKEFMAQALLYEFALRKHGALHG